MNDLRSELAAAERPRLLRYLSTAIHGFTIMARDPDMPVEEKATINNLIHYVAGHLMALTDPRERLTESRLDGIMELVSRLNTRLADKMRLELTR